MEIIREDFFHFLWKNLNFAQFGLKTTAGEAVYVVHPGYSNDGDGPDYRFAKIRLNHILFHGDIELHRFASDWIRHGHHHDSRYERVILHVVVHDDRYNREVSTSDGQRIPTLELRSSLTGSLARLWRAFHRPVDLPCTDIITQIPEPVFRDMMDAWDRSFFNNRLERLVQLYPSEKPITPAWQEMLIRGVFQGLGYHKNQENMLKMAGSLYNTYNPDISPDTSPDVRPDDRLNTKPDTRPDTKYSPKAMIPEAVEPVSGSSQKPAVPVAGSEELQKITHHLLQKAGLAPGRNAIIKRTDWDFSASRPYNQPVTRLHQAAELFIRLKQFPVKNWLNQPVDMIWKEICRLDHTPALGKNRRDVIFHNILIPATYLLGRWIHQKKLCDQARIHWKAQHLPLPKKVRTALKNSNWPCGKHFFKLATLHHYKYVCREKRCTRCDVMKYLVQT